MNDDTARTLLSEERARVEDLLASTSSAQREDRLAEAEPGDMFDSAEPLATAGVDDAVAESLRDRLAALDRAEQRLSEGRFGLSILTGALIPDERLRADPAAELTVEESAAQRV